jgi:GT2 family glycosyltransferase
MSLFILTLTWNGENFLKNLYPTLKEATKKLPIDSYWMIRDNASTDDTEKLINSWNDPDFVNYYKMDHNDDNFAKGNNYLVDMAEKDLGLNISQDYLLLCNNDITIEDVNSIKYMYDIINNDMSVGIVGARLLYPEVKGQKRMLQHCGVIFSPRYGYNPYHYRWQEFNDIHSQKNREFQAVTGAFLLVRANCFKRAQANGLDERFYWCFEDINFCLDVRHRQNLKVVYCGKTNITHHESVSLKKNNVNKKYMKHNVMLYQKLWKDITKADHYSYLQDLNYKLYT